MDPIVDLIKNTFNSTDDKGTFGPLGDKFVEFVKLREEAALQSFVIDYETDAKIRFLSECESKKDLGWMDPYSFRSLPRTVRDRFAYTIDPLSWGGMYLQYSRFMLHKDQVFKGLPEHYSIYVLKQAENFQIVACNADWTIFDWMGVNQFKSVQEDFNSRLLLSMGVSDNRLIVKESQLYEQGHR